MLSKRYSQFKLQGWSLSHIRGIICALWLVDLGRYTSKSPFWLHPGMDWGYQPPQDAPTSSQLLNLFTEHTCSPFPATSPYVFETSGASYIWLSSTKFQSSFYIILDTSRTYPQYWDNRGCLSLWVRVSFPGIDRYRHIQAYTLNRWEIINYHSFVFSLLILCVSTLMYMSQGLFICGGSCMCVLRPNLSCTSSKALLTDLTHWPGVCQIGKAV